MSFSNTVSQTTFNTRRMVDAAARRCKMPASQISGENLTIAKEALYLLLSDLANDGAPLWAIEKAIYPLYEGVNYVTTYRGTVEVLNANWRQLSEASGTVSTTSTSHTTLFDETTSVTTAGVKWSGASVPVRLERSDDGASWTVIQSEDQAVSAGEWTWFDLDSVVPSLYFRITATSGTLSYSEVYLGNTPYEVPLAVYNRDDYSSFPNKHISQNRAYGYWEDRKALSPVLRLDRMPSSTAEHCQIVARVHRHIMDVGTFQQDVEVPQQWLEAITAMLAAKLAMEWVEVDASLIPMLDSKADAAKYRALNFDTDSSPMRLLPDISAYSR